MERRPESAGEHERAFPSEAEWLSLRLPEGADLPSRDFAERTLAAIAAERALDRELEALDRELPRIVLSAHEAPVPRPDFVDGTLERVRNDRRTRWQQLLARHVAPEPSPVFVQRTLAALAVDRERAVSARPWRDRGWPLPALLAAAAALVVWFAWPRAAEASLQERLAAAATPAMAHAWTNPSAVLLAAESDRRDPAALRAGAPDGVWLAFAGGR